MIDYVTKQLLGNLANPCHCLHWKALEEQDSQHYLATRKSQYHALMTVLTHGSFIC